MKLAPKTFISGLLILFLIIGIAPAPLAFDHDSAPQKTSYPGTSDLVVDISGSGMDTGCSSDHSDNCGNAGLCISLGQLSSLGACDSLPLLERIARPAKFHALIDPVTIRYPEHFKRPPKA